MITAEKSESKWNGFYYLEECKQNWRVKFEVTLNVNAHLGCNTFLAIVL